VRFLVLDEDKMCYYTEVDGKLLGTVMLADIHTINSECIGLRCAWNAHVSVAHSCLPKTIITLPPPPPPPVAGRLDIADCAVPA